MNDIRAYVADRDTLFHELSKFIDSHQVSGKKLAILLIKIDHFRRINMIHGYPVGDSLLEEFSKRLQQASREKDFLARMGNAEFIMILPEIINEGHSILAANKLLGSIEEPIFIKDKKLKINAHIGISIYPDQTEDINALITKAETALITARASNDFFSVYSEDTTEDELNLWDIQTYLDAALDNDEFELYFQPQVNMQTGLVFGAEALIRWHNKERGYIRPDIFIPVAERTDQIHAITWWTINTAIRLIKDWPKTWTPLKVAINISTKVLKDTEFVESVRSSLNIWDTAHEQLTLEITESALMDDMTTSFITLEELKTLGLNISIDDFGTGYSSMAYFKYIPANELKIDQSFVSYMLNNPMDMHIVKTVIEMAHGFDFKVVAEGIENKETFNALKDLGCDIAQGYYLARPMPQKEFIEWLNNYQVDRG